ncbi:hypothetical protein [Rhizobium sp. BR 362]|uniref:hypothetical protein n=1 Tax=Rhizobium sp. BR 362 TaxID=3040670 RepID=UPI002F3E5617
MTKGVLRFFFDYCAGGCLWAGDVATRDRLGAGPVDAAVYDLEGRESRKPRLVLSDAARRLRDQLDTEHSGYLNPLYQLDPSPWTQAVCDNFNASVDRLLAILRNELGADYEILDQQRRYVEDPALGKYLAANPKLAAIKR